MYVLTCVEWFVFSSPRHVTNLLICFPHSQNDLSIWVLSPQKECFYLVLLEQEKLFVLVPLLTELMPASSELLAQNWSRNTLEKLVFIYNYLSYYCNIVLIKDTIRNPNWQWQNMELYVTFVSPLISQHHFFFSLGCTNGSWIVWDGQDKESLSYFLWWNWRYWWYVLLIFYKLATDHTV